MKFVLTVNGWHLGGITTFCRNLSAGLRNRGHEVILLVIHHAGAHNPVPIGLFDQCVVLPRGVSRTGPFIAKVAQTVDGLKPDFLVLNASPYAMAALPHINRAIIRTPVIHVPEEADLALSNLLWWDRVIAVSDFVAEAAKADGGCQRLSVSLFGVPVLSVTQQARKRLHGSPLRIVSAGRIIVPQKRMERLPIIANILADKKVDYHWTVLGDGSYLQKLRQEISRLGLTERFDIRGSVSDLAVADTFQRSDVFVMTSDYEGLPAALLETMALGVVPVVSRINGSTTCAVEHGKSGYLCEPSEPMQFANALAELAGNPSLGAAMSTKAAEIVAQNFSLDAFTERFLTIVGELRSQENRRPEPLPVAQAYSAEKPFMCLGFWRCLRNQTLGQVKRWLVLKMRRAATPERGGLPPSI